MKKSDLNLSPEQLTVYTALQRVRMEWTTLIILFVLLSVGFFAFLYAIFYLPEQAVAKGVVGGIDVLLGALLHYVVRNLFPAPHSKKPRK
jgi:uncharacterized membrane protein required for colicin V production